MIETKENKFIQLIIKHDKFILNVTKKKIYAKIGRKRSRDLIMESLKYKLVLPSYKTIQWLARKREDWLYWQGKTI